jgi:hypothetical protein
MSNQPEWTKFQEATLNLTAANANAAKHAATLMNIADCDKVYLNSRYQVNLRAHEHPETKQIFLIHLSIKRLDKEPIHDWRDLQRIKNEICGPECFAIEIYPPEKYLVDSANQYHLWCFDSEMDIPFVFHHRLVSEESTNGAKQRPFEVKPDDLITTQQMQVLLDAALAEGKE